MVAAGTSLATRQVDLCDMISRTRQVLGDALTFGGVLFVVIAILVSVDERVRERVSSTASRASSSSFSELRDEVRDIGATVVDVARTRSLDHAPLVIFVVAATVLVLFMVRT
jgi:hypothetical protein